MIQDWFNYIISEKIGSMLQKVSFSSERLFVDELKQEDAKKLFEIYSDKEAMKFRGSGAMESIQDAGKMIDNQFLCFDGVSKLRVAIRLNGRNDLIGTLLFKYKEGGKRCEIGFSFGKEYWGRGYAKEIVRRVEDYCREANLFSYLTAWCIKENSASVKVFQKANYTILEQDNYPQSFLFEKKLP